MAHHKETRTQEILKDEHIQMAGTMQSSGKKNGNSQNPRKGQRETENVSASAEETEGMTIGGFPWQFVVVVAIIGLGVLGMILRLIGLF